MSVLRQTKGDAPRLPGRAVQDSIPARGVARLFCPGSPSPPAVPGAATHTRCARSLRTARGVSDIFHDEGKCPFRCALRAEDRTSPQPGGGGQRRGLSRAPDRLLSARGKKTCTHCVRSLCTARGVSDIFHDEGKCPFRCALRAEARASPQPGGGGQRRGLSRAPGRLLSARGKKPCTHCARSLRIARGVSDIFHDDGKCPFRCALRAEARASPQPGGSGQRRGLSRAPDRLLSARGGKTCTHCARSLCTARDISDIFHDEEKCPFWGKRRMALPGCRAGGRRAGLRLSQWWRTVSRYLPLCLRLPRAVPPACPVRPGAADGTPTSPRRAETRPSPAFVPLLIFRCPCYTVVKITA